MGLKEIPAHPQASDDLRLPALFFLPWGLFLTWASLVVRQSQLLASRCPLQALPAVYPTDAVLGALGHRSLQMRWDRSCAHRKWVAVVAGGFSIFQTCVSPSVLI